MGVMLELALEEWEGGDGRMEGRLHRLRITCPKSWKCEKP